MTQLVREKPVEFEINALKDFNKFPELVIGEFLIIINKLEQEGQLREPDSKKLIRGLFELRVKLEGQYRCIYAYYENSKIIILVCFTKKTQKTLKRYSDLAYKRLKVYERNRTTN